MRGKEVRRREVRGPEEVKQEKEAQSEHKKRDKKERQVPNSSAGSWCTHFLAPAVVSMTDSAVRTRIASSCRTRSLSLSSY